VTPVFALQASAGRGGAAGRFWDRWVDSFVGSDPGLNRFRAALQAVLTIGAVIAAEGIFVHFTRAVYIQTHGAVLPAVEAPKWRRLITRSW
jgi:hypothetical protein